MPNQPQTRHTFVQLNNSFVHVTQYGSGESIIKSSGCEQTRETSLASHDKSGTNGFREFNPSIKKVIIFLPGNPGLLGIYHDFLCHLHSSLDGSFGKNQPTIVALSHNNFDHPDVVDFKIKERICLDNTELNFVERSLADTYRNNPHHIELQVLNKLIILKRIFKIDLEEAKLIFVGHSIGCYIILRLLQDRLLASAHEGSILIHPALENLALTEKGSRIDKVFKLKLDLVIQPLAFCLDKLLPRSMKKSLVRWMCGDDFVDQASNIAVESLMQLASHKALVALFQMAKSELASVKNMNTEYMIKPHATKLKLIYAKDDHWVNSQNRLILKKLFPVLYLEEQNTQHAFIMDYNTVIDYAGKVSRFISDFLPDNVEDVDN